MVGRCARGPWPPRAPGRAGRARRAGRRTRRAASAAARPRPRARRRPRRRRRRRGRRPGCRGRSPRGRRPGPALARSPGPPEPAQRRPQHPGDVAVGGGRATRRPAQTSSTASPACLADQPSPTSASTTCSRHGRRGVRRAAGSGRVPPPDGAPSRSVQLEHDPLGALARRCPGTFMSDVRSCPATAAAQAVGGVHREHRQRQPRADARDGLHGLEDVALVGVGEPEQGQRVLPDDEAGRQPRLLARPAGRRAWPGSPARACRPRRPRRPRRPAARASTGPRTEAITGYLPDGPAQAPADTNRCTNAP